MNLEKLNLNLVCFSHLRWDFVFQRPQHILTRFAGIYNVIYIEEHVYVDSDEPYTMRHVADNISVIVPQLNRLNNQENALETVIDKIFEDLNLNGYIFWYYNPMAVAFTGNFNPLLTIYDCMDELTAFKNAPPMLRENEEILLAKADLVFTGGKSLYEIKKDKHPHVSLFPSSIDKAHFEIARNNPADPEDQQQIPHPRLGFFGVIDERFDIELISSVAKMRPSWQFVFLGPVVKIDRNTLPDEPNIHYPGSKTYDQLPGYLAYWDIALIPFAINESTRYISPTKTPEYLAAGKPVISTPITDVVDPYGTNELVHIINSPEEFIKAAELELSLQDKGDWLHRVDDFLRYNSWDITWEEMNELINESLVEA